MLGEITFKYISTVIEISVKLFLHSYIVSKILKLDQIYQCFIEFIICFYLF